MLFLFGPVLVPDIFSYLALRISDEKCARVQAIYHSLPARVYQNNSEKYFFGSAPQCAGQVLSEAESANIGHTVLVKQHPLGRARGCGPIDTNCCK